MTYFDSIYRGRLQLTGSCGPSSQWPSEWRENAAPLVAGYRVKGDKVILMTAAGDGLRGRAHEVILTRSDLLNILIEMETQ